MKQPAHKTAPQNHTKHAWFAPTPFTGKEKDEETGYGYLPQQVRQAYHGARYMDYELMTMWLSVDPMADKYPNISPYAYCAWNPIIAIDPNGMDSVYVNRNGSEYKRLPGGNSTFINVNDNWQEVPMPGIIQERTQTHENTTGDEYQKYDYLIAAATGYFNADKNAGELQLYTDGSNPIPRSELAEIPNLDPTLVKAIAIQESNCGRKTTDILQTNNLQDWDPFKSKYGFIKGATPSVWKSLTGGIQILAAKGYKGGISGDGTYSFLGWKSATKAYNGGGNKRCVEFVYEMYQYAVIR